MPLRSIGLHVHCAPQADKNEEEDLLIYNWKPKYTGRQESGEEEQDFQQTYIFGPAGGQHTAGHPAKATAVVEPARKGSALSLLQKWLSWA